MTRLRSFSWFIAMLALTLGGCGAAGSPTESPSAFAGGGADRNSSVPASKDVMGMQGSDAGAVATPGAMGMHAGMHGSNRNTGVLATPASAQPFHVVPAVDLDPRQDVVEVHLEAKPADIELSAGHVVHMWTYNGLLPGPLIEAKVGDRVRVTIKNSLPEATTIHWHGLRVPAAMDGVEAVQAPIEPGAEYTYEFVVPDAGTFWYHPHMHSDVQVERGLYGPIVVRGPNEPETTSDQVVVLDDVLLDASWQIAPFGANHMEAMVGREGNVLLANGRAHPMLDVAPGGLHRFRFINSANARYFRIALPGHKLIQIGSEAGSLEEPQEHADFLLVPGQRVDLLVEASAVPDETAVWETRPYVRGHQADGGAAAPLFDLHNAGALVVTPAVPTALGTVPALADAKVTRDIKFGESMSMGAGGMGMGHMGGAAASHGTASGATMGPAFSFNGEVFPNVTPLRAQLGSVEEWALVNETPMDHPFHLHGFRFQVVADPSNGVRAWRDTLNVPAMQTVRIRIPLDDHAGTWMFHCHILEHAERGMMGELEVQ